MTNKNRDWSHKAHVDNYRYKNYIILVEKGGHNPRKMKHTVITPVAALTPASPNRLVAASVTRAVAAILTTLTPPCETAQLECRMKQLKTIP